MTINPRKEVLEMIEVALVLILSMFIFDAGLTIIITQLLGIEFRWIYVLYVIIANVILKQAFGFHLLSLYHRTLKKAKKLVGDDDNE